MFFESLKLQLEGAGYLLTEKLINAIEYGVPQNRERIILIGFKKEFVQEKYIKNFPLNSWFVDHVFPWSKYILYPRSKVFDYPWISKTPFQENSVISCPRNVPTELTVEYWFRKNDVVTHPHTQNYFKPKAGLEKFLSVDEGDDSRKSYKRLH